MLERFSDVRFDEAMLLLVLLIGAALAAILHVRRQGSRSSKSARFDITPKNPDKPE